ncbi:glycosyltransferase [Erythrobacter rubeus]|uniref:Glycosyltransferase n=1 Tax=Erythrobacter rubeus TaxID=2760803 RepID=A0ABR8KP56_9SPHN|nr:glycosyltransferase [Erythrobacter rubeus]MBD2841040.1 glycosyltransferase [Erythrobacter rubeus]
MTQNQIPDELDWRLPQRLAYVVDRSLPYSNDAYAYRTHAIAQGMVANGFEVIVFSRPGHPWDLEEVGNSKYVPLDTTRDGVRYIFLPTFDDPDISRRERLRNVERTLFEALSIFRPSAIMAVSNWENARPAANIARRLSIPFLYEARDLPQLSEGDHDQRNEEETPPDLNKRREAEIIRASAGLFAATNDVSADLIARGSAPERTYVISNGAWSKPPQAPILRRSQIGCEARHLLGCFVSPSSPDDALNLVRLVAAIRENGVDVDALLIHHPEGSSDDGPAAAAPERNAISNLVSDLRLGGHVHDAEDTSFDEIGGYYALCDALMFWSDGVSNRSDSAAALVPYHAASYGVPIFVSDHPHLKKFAAEIDAEVFDSSHLRGQAESLQEFLQGDHAKFVDELPAETYWEQRVAPLVSMMTSISNEEISRQRRQNAMGAPALETSAPPFDLKAIPETMFAPEQSLAIAAIGPCEELRDETPSFTSLTRTNIYSHLALAPPGLFIVDWAGLQREKTPSAYDEWSALWTISDMRLNRQMMDACRIAANRGWRLVVFGPVHGSEAPLFRTVSGLFDVQAQDEEEIA